MNFGTINFGTLANKLDSAAAKAVFRKHHITGKGIAAIRAGHAKKGDQFMIDLLKAIGPKTSVLNGNYGDEEQSGEEWLDGYIAQQTADSMLPEPEAGATGKGWAFWNQLLTTVGKTGGVIGQFKNDITGVSNTNADAAAAAAEKSKSNNTVIYIAVAVILVIVGFLIFKNKS